MKTKYPLTSIIIPAYNEEKNIPIVVKDVKKLTKKFPLEIIVVDDGSKDKTANAAKKAGATKVISYRQNKGKGGAFRVGIDAAKGDYIVQIDADHQFQPNEIPLFIEALHQGYDIAVGSRFNKGIVEQGSVSNIFMIGHFLISFATTFFSGIRVTDIMTGFKGFRTDVAKKLNLVTPHFGYEAEIIVKASKLGYSVAEIPITYTKRVFGSSSISAITDGLKVSSTIMKMYFTFPGPPPGHGVVGKRLFTLLLPIWFIFIIPLISLLTIGLPLNSLPIITQIFYSMLFFIFVWLLTQSKLAALLASLYFASGNIYQQSIFSPAQLFLPSIHQFQQEINGWMGFYILATFVLLSLISIQEKVGDFLKLSLIGLVLIFISAKLSSYSDLRLFDYILNSGLIIQSFILAKYFWNDERKLAWSFLLCCTILLISISFNIPFSALIGLSLFIGIFTSSVFLELISFRRLSSPLFSFRRILPLILLVLSTICLFIIKLGSFVFI